MTKLSITLAIATLTVSIAPAANAYSVAPEIDSYETSVVEQVNVLFGSVKDHQNGICELNVTPVLANALGLSTPQNGTQETVALASCEPE